MEIMKSVYETRKGKRIPVLKTVFENTIALNQRESQIIKAIYEIENGFLWINHKRLFVKRGFCKTLEMATKKTGVKL
jgi:hypothetical protein